MDRLDDRGGGGPHFGVGRLLRQHAAAVLLADLLVGFQIARYTTGRCFQGGVALDVFCPGLDVGLDLGELLLIVLPLSLRVGSHEVDRVHTQHQELLKDAFVEAGSKGSPFGDFLGVLGLLGRLAGRSDDTGVNGADFLCDVPADLAPTVERIIPRLPGALLVLERREVRGHLAGGFLDGGAVGAAQAFRTLQLLELGQQHVVCLVPVVGGRLVVAAVGIKAADRKLFAQRGALVQPLQAFVSLTVQFGIGGHVAQAAPSDVPQNPRDHDQEAEARPHLRCQFHVLEHRCSPEVKPIILLDRAGWPGRRFLFL